MDQELARIRKIASVNAHKILHDADIKESDIGHLEYATKHYNLQFSIYHQLKELLGIKTH